MATGAPLISSSTLVADCSRLTASGWGRGNYNHYRSEVIELLKVKFPGTQPHRLGFAKRLKNLPAA